jgi:hypothetical protein
MIPPTPTLIPTPASLPMQVPDQINLWYSTDAAIQYWRFLGGFGTLMQILALIAILIMAGAILLKWMREMSGKDSQE